jgi:predicted MFS family arabinose efflux permease
MVPTTPVAALGTTSSERKMQLPESREPPVDATQVNPRLVTAFLALSQLVAFGCLYYSFGALLPHMVRDFSADASTVSLAFTIGLLASGFTSFAVGWLLDRSGARLALLVGPLLGAVSLVVWSQANSVEMLTLAWLLVGAVSPLLFYDPAFVVVVRTVPAQKRRNAFLTITLVGGLSSSIFVPLLGAATELFTWRSAVLFAAAVLLLVNGSIGLLLAPSLGRSVRNSTASVQPPPSVVRTSDRSRFEFRRVVTLVVAFGASGFISGAIAAHYVSALLDFGHPPAFAYSAAGLIGVGMIGGRLAVGLGSRHFPITHLLAGTYLVQGVALAILSIAGARAGWVLVCTPILGAGLALVSLARPLIVQQYFDSARFGAISGRLSAVGILARAAGPAGAGFAITWLNDYGLILRLLVLPGLIAACAISSLQLRSSSEPEGPSA